MRQDANRSCQHRAPLAGAQHKEAQLLLEDPNAAPDASGALLTDETGDRKDGKKTSHVGKQYRGGLGNDRQRWFR